MNMDIIAYLISFSAVSIVALLGMVFTKRKVETEWYKCIRHRYTPPNIVFPIVWTLLYIILALSLAHSIRLYGIKNDLIYLYAINLVLNVLWCYFYFERKDVTMSIYILSTLIITTICIMVILYKRKAHWYVLIPYLIWLMFALFLNIMSKRKVNICANLNF